jgi:hypothetical protein
LVVCAAHLQGKTLFSLHAHALPARARDVEEEANRNPTATPWKKQPDLAETMRQPADNQQRPAEAAPEVLKFIQAQPRAERAAIG